MPWGSALVLACVWVVLALFRYSSRFVQTASALLGAETFLTLIGIPILSLAGFGNDEVNTPSETVMAMFVYGTA